MIDSKEYFVVFKNLLERRYYFDFKENWKQHKPYCEFITIVDSAQKAQELCTEYEKQEDKSRER